MMKAYWFRFVDDGEPNGWVGLAVGRNMEEIFWVIDTHGDAYCAEIMKVKNGGFCYHQIICDSDDDIECESWEANNCPLAQEDGWKKPKWEII